MSCIREMVFQDCEAVYDVEKAAFTDAWSLQSLQEIFRYSNNFYFVAEEDNRIVGFAGIMHIIDEAEIINIAVLPSYRKAGIGRQLMEAILQKGEELLVKNYYLEVRENNIPAIRLYKSFDFKMISKRKAYYQKPIEDALIMIKQQDNAKLCEMSFH